MRKNIGGYIYVTLLILILVVLGFVLSGGLILSKQASLTIEGTDRYTVADSGTLPPNPTLQLSTLDFVPQVCASGGLDIALVIDNSGSIDSSNLDKMKNAAILFVDALSGSPTQFSVTKFDTKAEVIQSFTDNFTDVKNAINNIPGGSRTNWQDALTDAKTTLDAQKLVLSRATSQDFVIFASDGGPNETGPNGGTGDPVATAVTVANEIKAGGARIITLGIGSGINQQNLQKISGSTPGVDGVIGVDVIITDNFDTFAADLAKLTIGICGP